MATDKEYKSVDLSYLNPPTNLPPPLGDRGPRAPAARRLGAKAPGRLQTPLRRRSGLTARAESGARGRQARGREASGSGGPRAWQRHTEDGGPSDGEPGHAAPGQAAQRTPGGPERR